jgi:hypothetical protein
VYIFASSLNIAWSIAEIEAAAAGFDSILPTHFWIACCNGCNLDYAKFPQDATPEIWGMGAEIARDFQVVREVLTSANSETCD